MFLIVSNYPVINFFTVIFRWDTYIMGSMATNEYMHRAVSLPVWLSCKIQVYYLPRLFFQFLMLETVYQAVDTCTGMESQGPPTTDGGALRRQGGGENL